MPLFFFAKRVECFQSIFELSWCEVCAQGFLSHTGQISAVVMPTLSIQITVV